MNPGESIEKDFVRHFAGMHGDGLSFGCGDLDEIRKSPCMHSIIFIYPFIYLI